MKDKAMSREYEVVVCGGGPGGVAAAIAAARLGARTCLIERYGHLGGLATGGLVILIPHLSGGTQLQEVKGICWEVIEYLDKMGGALHPLQEELGKDDVETVNKWEHYFSVVVEGRVRMSVYTDPEALKYVLQELLKESGVDLILHSLIVDVLTEGDRISAVITYSKSGRQVIKGEIFVDATGDGDVMAAAGEDFVTEWDPSNRSSTVALVFRLGNVDTEEFFKYKRSNFNTYAQLMEELRQKVGFRALPMPSWRKDVVWVNNWMAGIDPLDVMDLTRAETEIRKASVVIYEFLKANVPGFQRSFILDTAPQLGIRGSRRLIGQYILTKEDIYKGEKFPDTVAVFPPIEHNVSEQYPYVYFPLRALLPRKTRNLIVAGRCFSSDGWFNDLYNLITHCFCMGQAAGTAAALAVDRKQDLQEVDVGALRASLLNQGVFLGE